MAGLASSRYLRSIAPHPSRPLLSSSSSSPRNLLPPATAQPQPSRPPSLSCSAAEPLESALPDADSDPNGSLEASGADGGFAIEVTKVEGRKNRRLIRARVRVDAALETVWGVLTDYEGLANFIPGLAVSQLLDQRPSFARLYQVGQQDLALGLKFNAKGVLDCFEGDLEASPSGRGREIEFRMVDGDFQTFEGKWSIEQIDNNFDGNVDQEFQTTLYYTVELEPKLWLPVRLIEGRLLREFKTNLLSVREEAQRIRALESKADSH